MATDLSPTTTIYVSPKGNDQSDGTRATAGKGKAGPLATVHAAQRLARQLRKQCPDQPVRVELRGGTYCLDRPLVFNEKDSGIAPELVSNNAVVRAPIPVTYAAYRNETPVVSGGRLITGWKQTTHQGRRAWVTNIPAVKQGKWSFNQLFLNGRRLQRPRLPREGFFRIAKLAPSKKQFKQWATNANDRFHFEGGDLHRWANLQDVELVTLQCWIESRVWLRRVDEKKNLVTFDRYTKAGLREGHSESGHEGTEYYVENIFEALEQPGQWYLDRPTGTLYYLPKHGETLKNTAFYAPVLPEVMRFEGDGAKWPRYIRFEGLTFAHTMWHYPEGVAASEQAARMVPGAIRLISARDITFDHCTVTNVGNYGIEILEDSQDNRINHCTISDLGAGGVKAWHGTQRTTIDDCEIGHGGMIYHSAVGVLVGQSCGNKVRHNHIHDFKYTGVSLGWRWGYDGPPAYGNIVEFNHIHDIGHGYLSDMGGIYTLGASQGTRLRYNLIHDVRARGYGGWGIYPDEGTNDLLVENNIVYDCNRSPFHQHYGRDNVIRNNIFAFGGQNQLVVSRAEDHCSIRFTHNIVYFDQGVLIQGGYGDFKWTDRPSILDYNLYFREKGKVDFAGETLTQWRKRGFDVHGLVADPCFVNVKKRDFTLKKTSPALKLGFVPFDLSSVGPRQV